jgi:hypothetical protein
MFFVQRTATDYNLSTDVSLFQMELIFHHNPGPCFEGDEFERTKINPVFYKGTKDQSTMEVLYHTKVG